MIYASLMTLSSTYHICGYYTSRLPIVKEIKQELREM
jgi:hypothetical protein